MIPPMSDEAFRAAIRARDNATCARCGHHGHDPHHRQPRGRGGKNTWQNGILLCRNCHDWAHEQDPVAAAGLGFLLPSWQDPAIVPVDYHGRGRVLLGADSSINQVIDA